MTRSKKGFLDLRHTPPANRPETLRQETRKLEAGENLVIINSCDPTPLMKALPGNNRFRIRSYCVTPEVSVGLIQREPAQEESLTGPGL